MNEERKGFISRNVSDEEQAKRREELHKLLADSDVFVVAGSLPSGEQFTQFYGPQPTTRVGYAMLYLCYLGLINQLRQDAASCMEDTMLHELADEGGDKNGKGS